MRSLTTKQTGNGIIERFWHSCSEHVETAMDRQFPIFTASFGEETVVNSSPFLITHPETIGRLAGSCRRKMILSRLLHALVEAPKRGIEVECLLLAGSFIDIAADPADIDVLMLYRLEEKVEPQTLPSWIVKFAPSVDIKVCPVDVSAALLVKRSTFFTSLFAHNRSSGALDRGCLIMDRPLQTMIGAAHAYN